MTDRNRLIKGKTFTPGVAGQAYIAPRPERTVMEKRRVCGYYPADGSADGRFVFAPADPSIGRYWEEWIWVTDGPVQTIYVCRDQLVPVKYPATPGQPYIAEKPASWDYQLGWNSGARSQCFISGDGKASFQARASDVGAIAGLNSYESPLDAGGLTIDFGWYFTHGTARVFESGVFNTGTWPYTDATVFAVRRVGARVQYLIDGTVVYTSTASSNGPLWLQAALYAGDDEVFNPVLTVGADPALTVTGSLNLTLPQPRTALGNALGLLRLRLPQPSVALLAPPWGSGGYRMGQGGGALTLRLPAPRVAAREGMGGVLRMKVPSAVLGLRSGGLAAPSFSALNLLLPAPLPGFAGLIGAVGQLHLKLPQQRVAASDRQIGRLRARLPVAVSRMRAWPYDELPGTDGRMMLAGSAVAAGVVTLPVQPMEIAVAGTITPYASVTLGSVTLAGMLTGSIVPAAVVTLPTTPLVLIPTGRIAILSELNELFVMNTKGGGTTQYENYPFNSFAKIGGRYYGAGEDGLYLLEGDNDAGKPIDACFGMGQLNFGSPHLKTVTYCYLGASAGGMRLELQALLNGNPATYSYSARGHGASMREVRFDIGRGLRSTYVMPTFYNCNGAPFEVDAVRFLIAESARRI